MRFDAAASKCGRQKNSEYDFRLHGPMVALTMKKTTRNYFKLLIANALLISAVAVFWHVKVSTEVLNEKKLPSAIYLKNLETPENLADIKGQWTVLNLWASWCAPCLVEMPQLQNLHNQYKSKGLQVIAISLDQVKSKDEMEAILTRHRMASVARNWDEKGQVFGRLNPEGLPMTYILDPAGNIRATVPGDKNWDSAETKQWLDELMVSKASPSVPAR